jgi:preprotein translocase subunit SecG
MNPILAVGQIIVSVFLIISVLMQARGVGLSSAFGGDSSVYRSRRGIERQLMRFTVLLIILFVLFSLVGYLQTK